MFIFHPWVGYSRNMTQATNGQGGSVRFSSRKFGVEMEIVGRRTSDMVNDVRKLLSQNGVEVSETDYYSHARVSGWKVVTDSSINGATEDRDNPEGCEVVSPVLQGEEGIAQVKRVAGILSAAGYTVNRTCGLHVHVDATDLSGEEVKAVAKRYAKFQGEIDAFMPPSRRNNHFARKLEEADFRSLNGLTDKVQIGRRFDRYRTVNLASLVRHGTVEFRQHSGSLNGSKIENWIRFCVSFVEASRADNIVAAPVAANSTDSRLAYKNKKYSKLYYLLCNARHSLTASEIAQPMGCSESAVPGLISRMRSLFAGCKVKKYRGYGYKMICVAMEAPPREEEYPSTPPVRRAIARVARPARNERLIKLFNMLMNSYNVSLQTMRRQLVPGKVLSQATIMTLLSQLRTKYGCKLEHRRGSEFYRICSYVTDPNNTNTVSATVTAVVDSLWLGMSPEVCSFYNERASEFASN